MKILWLKTAEDDLDGAFDYLFERDPQAALRTSRSIRRKIDMLSDHPYLGRAGRVESTRELVVAGTPYIVVYTVDARLDSVVILRVLHGRRMWPEENDEGDESGR